LPRLTLYYSHNKRDWLIAKTITGDITTQTTGTGKTIIWDNRTDNVRHGKFHFKIETSQCELECVMINGVCWATRNVDAPETFTANPKDFGMFYQWNRNIGWSTTNPMINSNGGTTWDGSNPIGTTWETTNNVCPAGFRVPTLAEIQSLLNTAFVTNVWTPENGINGRKFTDISTGNTLFLPAVGNRSGVDGTLGSAGSLGYYWSAMASESYETNTYSLYFHSGDALWIDVSRRHGQSVRCVAE